jgi:hypothetical protein
MNQSFLQKMVNYTKQMNFILILILIQTQLEWLGFEKVLHHSVSSGLSDIQLPLLQYEPISFINEIICKEKKVEIIAGLNNGSISFDDFYTYLSKYASNPLFPAAEIKSFPIKTLQATLPKLVWFNLFQFKFIKHTFI